MARHAHVQVDIDTTNAAFVGLSVAEVLQQIAEHRAVQMGRIVPGMPKTFEVNGVPVAVVRASERRVRTVSSGNQEVRKAS